MESKIIFDSNINMINENLPMTQAQEIRYHVRILLSDGKEHSLKEIKDYVQNKSGKSFSVGCYSGALRDLINKEKGYEIVARGIYRFDASKTIEKKEEFNLSNNIKNILTNTEKILYAEIGKINLLDASDNDIETATKVKTIIKYLEEKSEEF